MPSWFALPTKLLKHRRSFAPLPPTRLLVHSDCLHSEFKESWVIGVPVVISGGEFGEAGFAGLGTAQG